MDLTNQPEIVQTIARYMEQGWDLAITWLLSPAAWSQFILLIASYVLAVLVSKRLSPLITRLLKPQESATSMFASARRFVLLFLPLMLPLLAYAFTAIGEVVVRSLFDSGAVIAFGKRVFLFLAIRSFAKDMLHDPLLRLIGKFVLIPVGALYAIGALDSVANVLRSTVVPLGNLSFDLLWLIQFVVVGGVIFWLGRWSNDQSTGLINQQPDMEPATRQLATKAAEITIFGVAFLVLMNIMGISLTSLAVLGGAIGVGLGFGSTLLGKKAAMLCTASVEEVIDKHYLNQINQLDISEKDLKKAITKFRQDEIDHKDIAYEKGATKKGPYLLLDKIIKTGSKIAINISEKI